MAIVHPFSQFKTGAPTSPQTFNYVFDGDTNGLFHFLGTNFRSIPWTNPHTLGTVTIGAFNSSNAADLGQGTLAGTVDRSDADENRTSNSAGGYWRFQLPSGQAIQITKYSFRCRPTGQGTASNIANLTLGGSSDGTSWTNLNVQTGLTYSDSADWKTLTVVGAAAWRYIRILHQGNVTGANDFFFLTEWEFYGTFTF